MPMSRTWFALVAVCVLWGAPCLLEADPVVWVCDASGLLARVDVPSGQVEIVGDMGVVMTDIAFSPTGALYGVSFLDLYRIDPATAGVTAIGPTGISANALVFDRHGQLYAAGDLSTSLYTIEVQTGAATAIGSIGARSAGDLAFVGDFLYLSSSTNRLIRIDLTGGVTSEDVGGIGFANVYALATPDNRALYGVSGLQVLEVNTSTGAGSVVSHFAWQGVGSAFGSSFTTEAVPEPASLLLVVTLAGLAITQRPTGRQP